MMKFLYVIILLIITANIYAQERFFSLVEGWTTVANVEYDDKYIIVGTGLNNDNLNNIQFNELSKTGELTTSWQINISGAIGSDIGTQQSLRSIADGNHIMGVTILDEIIKSKRLIFNYDFSEVLDSTWTYQAPQGEQSDMFATYYPQPNEILHGVHYHNGSTVNSTLLSTDTLGNVLWESNFSCGGTYCWMEPRHIHRAHDGGYIFTNNERRGFLDGGIVGELDIGTIIKTDSLGIQEWRIRPGGMGEPYTSSHIVLQPTDDGNYLCAWADNFWRTSEGPSLDHYSINPDATIWFAKIAPDGSKLWEKNIQEQIDAWGVDAGAYPISQMLRLSDDNFAIIGNDKLFKINQEGNIIWARKFNPLNLEFSYEQIHFYLMQGINETSDGGFIMTGEFMAHPGTVYPDFVQEGFVLKVDEYGCLEEGCQEDDPIVSVEVPEVSEDKLLLYPNPTTQNISIKYQLPKALDRLTLSIHNITGKVIHEQSLLAHEGSVRVELDKNLSAGTYFCHLAVDGQVIAVERFVLLR